MTRVQSDEAQAEKERVELRTRFDAARATLPTDGLTPTEIADVHRAFDARTETLVAQIDGRPIPYNIARFNGETKRGHRGLDRDPTVATEVLFPRGIELDQPKYDCIMAYIQDMDDWILGALLGHINRGKKKMIRQYQQVLIDDPDVATFPATEDGLIRAITARVDYKTLPEQLKLLRLAQTGGNLA